MAILADSTFTIFCEKNDVSLKLFEDSNMIGYFTFKNEHNNLITQKINIIDIVNVINSNNCEVIDKLVSFGYVKEHIITLFFFFKYISYEFINIESGYYSKDFYSIYDPYGFIPLELVKMSKEESIKCYFENVEKSNRYTKLFK